MDGTVWYGTYDTNEGGISRKAKKRMSNSKTTTNDSRRYRKTNSGDINADLSLRVFECVRVAVLIRPNNRVERGSRSLLAKDTNEYRYEKTTRYTTPKRQRCFFPTRVYNEAIRCIIFLLLISFLPPPSLH